MCIEKMIDGMSDGCYLEHYCFRHQLHSCRLADDFYALLLVIRQVNFGKLVYSISDKQVAIQ